MRFIIILLISVFLFSTQIIRGQDTAALNFYHRQCDTVFRDFIAAARTIALRHQYNHTPIDSADIGLLMRNHWIYFDVNREIPINQHFDLVSRGIQQFCEFFSQDTSALKMRLLDSEKDKMIYQSFDDFTRHQSFAVTKANEETPLFYLLILNGPLVNQTTPKIISWKVVYVYGRFLFENVLNQPSTYQLFNIFNH